ncbi:phosphoribosyl transferase [Candidatus Parcubacteria bacterium]|nr:phosphoribosyl transferase [Candidatus Parcubacteria bacterium]
MRFKDRAEAGRQLAAALERYRDSDAVVYALPRGGVVLGAEIARRLNAPLALVIARKIGHPLSPEFAIGAVTENGEPVLNQAETAALDLRWLEAAVKRERAEARRRHAKYLAGRRRLPAEGRVAIVVDDGIATGLTMLAAIKEVKRLGPRQTVVAVPVVPKDTVRWLEAEAGELAALEVPERYLGAVGAYYDDFEQVEDEEVITLMNQAAA